MRRIKTAIVLGLLLGASGASAKDCSALATQTDMNICEGEIFEKADARLNDVYRRLAAKISAKGKSKLVEAERAWLTYRDLQCDFDTLGVEGGSIHGMMVAQCRTEMTKEQTKRLERQLTCQEGDMSCGNQ
ncbi:lysozyme inhibitor LprI family protein [Methylocystis echinoides]|uniref:lysozyme inhibitor LprI family protein n=1 Tax=Methylocystis echinoides TaxID=29468 RepID=UPI0034393E58